MKVLIADDDPVTLDIATSLLQEWGYETVAVNDGAAAWEVLRQDDGPSLVVSDWQMPGLEGDELCRRARAHLQDRPIYIVLVTAANVSKGDKVSGLSAGADDYLPKPWNVSELRARLQVGERVLKLQMELRRRVQELEQALTQVKHLRGLLPICAHCKKIRDDKNYWHSVESYVTEHSAAEFTHGICPACLDDQLKDLQKKADAKAKAKSKG
jgi:sigma-B regulation protein RsbU (phosphoserine phosphatase)